MFQNTMINRFQGLWFAIGLMMPWVLACGAERAESGSGPLVLLPSDVVVFCGGEDVVAWQEQPFVELCLTLHQPEARFRNLAWEGDTVFAQPRMLNFGSMGEQLNRAAATVVFAQFGQSECLDADGDGDHEAFVSAYEELTGVFADSGRRAVLVSPTPFERVAGPLPDASRRNDELAGMVESVRRMAARRGCWFVDLFTPLRDTFERGSGLTRDGMHLSVQGQWVMSRELARQLGVGGELADVMLDPESGTLAPAEFEDLRRALVRKNRLWFDYWRPMNWAFLKGDRIEQPSSRDHRNPEVRWFPREMEEFVPMIEAEEERIRDLAERVEQGEGGE
jgi:hypothetical protein